MTVYFNPSYDSSVFLSPADCGLGKAFQGQEALLSELELRAGLTCADNEHADRVIVMDNGRISGFDTPENLLKNNEIYREVHETQMEGGGDFDIEDARKEEEAGAGFLNTEKGGAN